MLSQIGCITLPPATLDTLYKGEVLDESEQEMVKPMPTVAEKFVHHIPRFDAVREILRQHPRNVAATKQRSNAALDEEIPWGARALKIALEFDLLDAGETHSDHPFAIRRGRRGLYDRRFWRLLRRCAEAHRKNSDAGACRAEVTVGMVFGEDLKSSKGLPSIARGQEVTPAWPERMRNFAPELAIREPARMILQTPPATTQPVLTGSRS
jgi:hypothetical protein